MSPRKTAILFTVAGLQLIVNLLKNHVQVAQYERDSDQFQLTQKLERLLDIAKELEPIS